MLKICRCRYLKRFRLQILLTEKNEQKEIGSSIFRMFSPRRYSSRMRSILLIIFTALPHLHVGLLRRLLSFPGALFLRFVLFWLRRCGVGFPREILLVRRKDRLHILWIFLRL